MKKFISVFSVFVVLLSFLVFPAAAYSPVSPPADTSSLEYAIFNDGIENSFFVYKGVEYGFGGYVQDFPVCLMLAHPEYLYLVRVPSIDVFDITISSDSSGFYLNLPIGCSGIKFKYLSHDTLDPEIFSTDTLDSKLYILGDLSVVQQSFLCNVSAISWSSDSGQSGQFLPSRPTVYSRPVLNDDSVYRIGWEDDPVSSFSFSYKRFIFDDFKAQVSSSALLYTGQSALCMFQTVDDIGQFSVLFSNSGSFSHRLDVIFVDGSYHLRITSTPDSSSSLSNLDHIRSRWSVNFDVVTGSVTSLSKLSYDRVSYQSVTLYDLGASTLPDVISCLKASVVPIYLTTSTGQITDSVLFYQNPRGNQLSSQYRPLPPLDDVLPDYTVQEDVLLQDALNKWESSFESLESFIDSFIVQFEGSFVFAGAVFNLFADIPVIKFFLYVSLLLGFVMVLLNLAGSAIRAIAHKRRSD